MKQEDKVFAVVAIAAVAFIAYQATRKDDMVSVGGYANAAGYANAPQSGKGAPPSNLKIARMDVWPSDSVAPSPSRKSSGKQVPRKGSGGVGNQILTAIKDLFGGGKS